MAATVRWLRRIFAAVAALLLLGLAAVVAVLNSEAGTRWVIDQADRRIPGKLGIDNFSGTLWSGIKVPLLTYTDPDREVIISGLVVEIDWTHTATARIVLAEASSNSVVYRSLASQISEPKPLQLALRPLPVVIAVARSSVGEIQFSTSGRTTILRDIAITGLRVRGNKISAASAAASSDAGSLAVNALAAQLDGDVPISADIAWQDDENRWSGSGRLQGTLAMLAFDQDVLGPYPATARGTVQLLRRVEPLVDANIRWTNWRFGDYQATSGRVHVKGFLPAYETDFQLQVSDGGEHSVGLNGTASGDVSGLSTIDASVDSSIGQLAVEGSLHWSPALTSVLRINGRGLDLSKSLPVPESDIGIDLGLEMQGPRKLLFTIHSIDGTYNDERFDGQGKISLTDLEWRCSQCEIGIGSNRAVIQGSMTGDLLEMDVRLKAPRLDQLWPGLGGAVTLGGALQGTLTAPTFSGQASGDSLSLYDWQLAHFSIDSRASTLERLDLTAMVEGLQQGDRLLGTFDVALKGAPAQLSCRVGWKLTDFAGQAVGTLDLSTQYPQGSVQTARFEHPISGSWQLMESFSFSVGQAAIEISPHAWTSGDAEFSVNEFRILDAETMIDAKLERLPLQFLQPFMYEISHISGYASADIRLSQSKGEWLGSVIWDQQQTRLRVAQPGEQPVDIVIPVVRIDAQLLGVTAKATASIEIDPGMSANLEVSLAQLTANPDIEAHLTIDGKDWQWVPAIAPEIDRFEGAISAEMFARGPWLNPSLSGELRWRDGRLVVPALNVPISDIDLVVAGTSSGTATVKGQARAGGGVLTIDGRLDDLMRNSRSFTVQVSGQNAEILNWPEYKLFASPDIVVAGGLDGVSINGRIDIPRADIQIKQLPEEAVKPSADVIVDGRENQAEMEIPVTGQADVALGKRVHVSALGLDTKLTGQLRITVPENRRLRAEGKLTLVDGVFEAYGQRLTITDGSMLFTGPLDNPFVNVRAVRKIESIEGTITAGIDLRGPAQNLVASVFSEPSMAESDALSYLVLGRPLAQSTATEGSELSGAAVALGLRQATRITGQIGQALGLDELDVSGDGSSTTSLVAGKQVNSRLYLRYAYGVFSQLGSVLLRYRLSRRLTLETSTGESPSMDLLYLVEKP